LTHCRALIARRPWPGHSFSGFGRIANLVLEQLVDLAIQSHNHIIHHELPFVLEASVETATALFMNSDDKLPVVREAYLRSDQDFDVEDYNARGVNVGAEVVTDNECDLD
jgi:hypothetical protein